MDSREDKDQFSARCAASHDTPQARECGSISTERIMRAVEEQRRISQQLDDLRLQQKRRTAHLPIAGLKLMGALWCVSGSLLGGFALLLLIRPLLFERLLNASSDAIAFLVMLSEQARVGLALVPSRSWFLSAAALVVVLMMGLWIRLMRHPRDA